MLYTVSQELLRVWGDAIQSGNTRLIKIQIVNGKILFLTIWTFTFDDTPLCDVYFLLKKLSVTVVLKLIWYLSQRFKLLFDLDSRVEFLKSTFYWIFCFLHIESLVPTATEAAGSTTYEQDFVKATNLMEPTTPCYIVYRLDTKNDYGYQWILMAYTPDKAKVKKDLFSSHKNTKYHSESLTITNKQNFSFGWILPLQVRDKMTYAATRATLKRQLGGNYFVNEIFGTIPVPFQLCLIIFQFLILILIFIFSFLCDILQKDFSKESYQKFVQSQHADAPLTLAEQALKEEVLFLFF